MRAESSKLEWAISVHQNFGSWQGIVAYIFIDYVSFIWVCSPGWHYDSKLPHVFLWALIDGNSPDYTKTAIDYLSGDLLKRAFRSNAVEANVATKLRERTNAHNSDDNENTDVVDQVFKCIFSHFFIKFN